jgi:phosphate transport system protein
MQCTPASATATRTTKLAYPIGFILFGSNRPLGMRSAFHQQLSTLNAQLAETCGMTAQAIHRATRALLEANLSMAETTIADHHDIAAASAHVEHTTFVLLALQAPVAADLRAVISAIRIAADVERMGALAVHVAETARRRHPRHVLPAQVNGHIALMGEVAEALASSAQQVLLVQDPRRAAQIRRDDDAMDELHRQLLAIVIDREWPHGVAAAVDVTLLGRFYERFADHAVEIARRVIFQAAGESASL